MYWQNPVPGLVPRITQAQARLSEDVLFFARNFCNGGLYLEHLRVAVPGYGRTNSIYSLPPLKLFLRVADSLLPTGEHHERSTTVHSSIT